MQVTEYRMPIVGVANRQGLTTSLFNGSQILFYNEKKNLSYTVVVHGIERVGGDGESWKLKVYVVIEQVIKSWKINTSYISGKTKTVNKIMTMYYHSGRKTGRLILSR